MPTRSLLETHGHDDKPIVGVIDMHQDELDNLVDKLEDVCSEKGREWCRDGADVKADPIGKGLRVHAIPATGSADLVDQGLEGRVISGADCIEEFRLRLEGVWVRVTEVVGVACGDLTVHGHVA